MFPEHWELLKLLSVNDVNETGHPGQEKLPNMFSVKDANETGNPEQEKLPKVPSVKDAIETGNLTKVLLFSYNKAMVTVLVKHLNADKANIVW